MAKDVKAIMHGAGGRMGKFVIEVIEETSGIALSGAIEMSGHPAIGKDSGMNAGVGAMQVEIMTGLNNNPYVEWDKSDVVIDYTNPEAALCIINACELHKKPLVIGTTGLDVHGIAALERLSKIVPVVWDSNMSMGANMMFDFSPKIDAALGGNYDIEIVEAHHGKKKDAPSGTANKMAKILAKARGLSLKNIVKYGRKGFVGERTKDEIGIHAVRAGDIVGEHTVIFGGRGERIEFIHRVSTRKAFAQGAIRAAFFASDPETKPGFYNMSNVLKAKNITCYKKEEEEISKGKDAKLGIKHVS